MPFCCSLFNSIMNHLASSACPSPWLQQYPQCPIRGLVSWQRGFERWVRREMERQTFWRSSPAWSVVGELMGILNPPWSLTTLMDIWTIPPAQLNDYDLLTAPLLLPISVLSLFFCPLIQRWEVFLPFVMMTQSLSLILGSAPVYRLWLISLDTFVDGEGVPPQASFSQTSLPCFFSATVSLSLLVFFFLLLSSFTLGYKAEITMSFLFSLSVFLSLAQSVLTWQCSSVCITDPWIWTKLR